jgi:aquaporin NIP
VLLNPLLRKSCAEFIGTFAMIFAGTGAIVVNDVSRGAVTHPGIALTWGLVVMALIFTLGRISGAQMNPAVTLSLCAARVFPLREVPAYLLAQIAGALAASMTLHLLFPENAGLGGTLPAGTQLQSFVLEFLMTGGLVLVILCAAVHPARHPEFAPIAIGAVIGLEAMFAGPISGASMNPARSLAPAVISGNLASLWIYLAAPVLGGLTAVPIWRLIAEPAKQTA